MKHFLSCDWGTSSFRIRLINIIDGKVLAEEKSSQGIASTFNLWLETGGTGEERKTLFYLNIIKQHINKLENKTSYSLKGVKIIISGMASSSLGFINIAYSTLPVPVDGSGINTAFIGAGKAFDHDVLIISGVKKDDDVMRGEETQLIGCISPSASVKNEVFLFPGTHAKHISVKDNYLVDFKTYMTGEVFDLLTTKSILKSAVEINPYLENNMELSSFLKGVKESGRSNILQSIFRVRPNQLFNLATSNENYNYLSGLIIGYELNDLKSVRAEAINLVCGTNLEMRYRTALQETGSSKLNLFPAGWADEAVTRGHLQIGRKLKILT